MATRDKVAISTDLISADNSIIQILNSDNYII